MACKGASRAMPEEGPSSVASCSKPIAQPYKRSAIMPRDSHSRPRGGGALTKAGMLARAAPITLRASSRTGGVPTGLVARIILRVQARGRSAKRFCQSGILPESALDKEARVANWQYCFRSTESVQNLGRSISSDALACGKGCSVCSVRWSVPVWRCWPDAFAVTRGGHFERRDAPVREFPIQNRDADLLHPLRRAMSATRATDR